jgi:hypothetical protein
MVDELKRSEDYSLALGMLSANGIAAESTHAALSTGGQGGSGCMRKMSAWGEWNGT